MGVGSAVRDSKKVEFAVKDMTAIAGQKPVVTHAKQANAAFKLREGMAIGCKVTLRKDRMYEFLDRLVNIALRGRLQLQPWLPKIVLSKLCRVWSGGVLVAHAGVRGLSDEVATAGLGC